VVPATGQVAGLQDLLHHHEAARSGFLLQAAEIALGVAQAVRVVDAQPVEHARLEPSDDQLVGVAEDGLVLHPQGGQRVDVEEAPVVELPAGRPPEGEAVVLALQQGVEGVVVGVDPGHLGVDGLGHGRILLAQPGQAGSEDLLVAVALPHALPVGGPRRWQAPEGGGQALQLGGAAPGGGGQEQVVERAGGDGHDMVVVVDGEAAALALEPQLTGLQHPAVVIAQDRDEHLVAPLGVGDVPVDVEV
jgi:hypothetical protein